MRSCQAAVTATNASNLVKDSRETPRLSQRASEIGFGITIGARFLLGFVLCMTTSHQAVKSQATFEIKPFLIVPNKQAKAAGVIPSIRAAWAKVDGLISANFCRSSIERLGIAE